MPVTKILILWNTILPLLVSVLDKKYLFYLKFDPYIFQWHQFWRLLTNQLSFLNESQVLFGCIILYSFRVVERHHSSHKYISRIFLVYLYHIFVFQAIPNFILKALVPDRWNFLQRFEYSTGCFPAIGAVLYDYTTYLPVVYRFEIRDLIPDGSSKAVFNDKIFVYILCTQLALSEGLNSLVPIACGWMVCLMLNLEVLPGSRWRMPFFMEFYKFLYKNVGRRQ